MDKHVDVDASARAGRIEQHGVHGIAGDVARKPRLEVDGWRPAVAAEGPATER